MSSASPSPSANKPAKAMPQDKAAPQNIVFRAPNPAAFTLNMVQAALLGQKIIAAMASRSKGPGLPMTSANDIERVAKTFTDVIANYAHHPIGALQAYGNLWQGYGRILLGGLTRLWGRPANATVEPERGDKRFKDQSWDQSLAFNMLKQVYLLTSRWVEQQARNAYDLDHHDRDKAEFYVRQLSNALSPSNFLPTNPEVLRATLESDGENLVIGLQNFLEDLERGDGQLDVQQTDMSAFEIGRNLALTPGKVVYQNSLIQLIQYEPTTKKVYERPLLIFPPWINKYYILDLTPEKSFISHCLSKGYTVFVVSWVNPNAKLAMKNFEDYMTEGVFAALDAVEQATGTAEVNTIGYCIGGTLLGASLAHMAATGDKRIKSATFFAAQMDFSEAGELQVFIDEEQLKAVEQQMEKTGGYLEGATMARTFNMLRSNDLIWSNVVNNYLLGKKPRAFDLLFWNADATRMPAKMHVFYLRECYLNNNLAEGRMELAGRKLDLSMVKIPIYLQSSREDHIAPYRSVYKATKLFSGPIRFIIAGSGHIAGVINPPSAKKYQYWTNSAKKLPKTANEWLDGAEETPGSWWPDWEAWLKTKSGPKVPARAPGDGALKIIEPAPGSYVQVKAKG